MTVDEFFGELEKVQAQFAWTLANYPSPAAERRSRPRLHLRAVTRLSAVPAIFDPIGAVCYARTGQVFEPDAWLDAAETLGLLPSDSGSLFAVSNDRTWTGPAGMREPLPELIAMRARMIEAVGLSVRTS